MGEAKLRGRKQAFNLEVYALAALCFLGPAVVRALPERVAKGALAAGEEPAPLPPHASSWVYNW